jgi:plasmid stabilization system protein ParE
MAAKLLFTSETNQDLDEAFEWYERRRLGLGEEFLIEVADCIDSVCANPEMRPKVVDEYRQAIVHRFPYSVIYGYEGESVTVYAVVHNARNPREWRRRIGR